MSMENNYWAEPLTPWEVVQRQFFADQAPDAAWFAQQHELEEVAVSQVFSGNVTIFSSALCKALSATTNVSEQFFANLSDQYQKSVT